MARNLYSSERFLTKKGRRPINLPMKKGIHPKYEAIIFRDKSADFSILTRSTRSSDQKMKWTDGKEYPVIDLEISSASHPFFTGKQKIVDTAGRIEKFKKKYKIK